MSYLHLRSCAALLVFVFSNAAFADPTVDLQVLNTTGISGEIIVVAGEAVEVGFEVTLDSGSTLSKKDTIELVEGDVVVAAKMRGNSTSGSVLLNVPKHVVAAEYFVRYVDELGTEIATTQGGTPLVAVAESSLAEITARVEALELTDPVPGPQGPAGADGVQGPSGADGLQGLPGVVGATGPQGLPGADGAQGLPGTDGSPGADGAQGLPGADGTDGAAGSAGADGVDGAPGADGAQGPIGPAGPQGLQGVVGSTGLQGLPGTDGAQGLPGTDGAAGAQGLAGADGADGTQGPAGADGVNGADGSPGAEGVQGPIGPAGPQGEPGNFVHNGESCLAGEAIVGFDIVGNILCAPVAEIVLGADCPNNQIPEGANLLGADLRNCILIELQAQNFNFRGAVLSDAILVRANLGGANLETALMNRTNLSNATLVGANLVDTSFKNATMDNAILADATMYGADFRAANGIDVNFERTMTQSAYLFSDVNFPRANFSGALFTNVGSVLVERLNMPGSSFIGTNWGSMHLVDSDLSGSNFTDSIFDRGVVFERINLVGITMGSLVSRPQFITDSDMTGAVGTSWFGVGVLNTICPDGTNSDSNGSTCDGHFIP